MAIITLHESLSFDTEIKLHATIEEARSYMATLLCREGWPIVAAIEAAEAGSPVLVANNGDDETIEIRSL